MRNHTCVEPVCTCQHEQRLLDAEHRLRETLALAREQLMQCQNALDQLARFQMSLLLQQVANESSSACPDIPSLGRCNGCPESVDDAPLIAIPAKPLSPREAEVLHLIAAGMSNRLIADALFLSPRTVERHIANIYLKIDVHSKAEATAFALHHDLV